MLPDPLFRLSVPCRGKISYIDKYFKGNDD